MKQHRPTYQTRRDVSEWSTQGYTHNSIARNLNIHPDTLRKHYPEELEVSMKVKTELVVHALFEKALEGNVNAQKFWLERVGGDEWLPMARKIQAPVSETYDIEMSPVIEYLDSPTKYLQPNDLNRTHDGRLLNDDEYRKYLFDRTRQ